MRTLSLASLLLFSILVSCVKTSNGKEGENKIKVAVFDGNGASPVCVTETYEALKIDTGIAGSLISAREISEDRLNDFDVIIFPGGSASKELNNLGESAADKVVKFVKAGHGAVGICAGGYLFSTTKGYPSLQLVSATEWDRAHYDKGRALVEFKLTQKAGNCFLSYQANGAFYNTTTGLSLCRPTVAKVTLSNTMNMLNM